MTQMNDSERAMTTFAEALEAGAELVNEGAAKIDKAVIVCMAEGVDLEDVDVGTRNRVVRGMIACDYAAARIAGLDVPYPPTLGTT